MTFLASLGFTMLIIDVAWAIFAQASVQYAVCQGVRWGITCRYATGQTGLNASITQIVEQNSMGFITSSNAASVLSIQYLNPSTLATISSGGPAGGNVLKVSVSGLQTKSFGPLYRNVTAVATSAVALDVMEGPTTHTCTQ